MSDEVTRVTPERLRQARELNRHTTESLAAQIGVSAARLRAWETGRAQPDSEALEAMAFALQVQRAFFFQPPPPQFPLGSLLFHEGGRVCDPCERETGEEEDAQQVCIGCEDDLCAAHVTWWSFTEPLSGKTLARVAYCPTCYAKVTTPRTRQSAGHLS